jgi:hypothetical protein
MMDPEQNALYAAQLVKDHMAQTGDWIAAAGAYHSATPDVAERYLNRFVAIYEGVSNGSAEEVGLLDKKPSKNRFPLLQGGEPHSAGSIVPRFASSGPLFGDS